MKTSSIQNKNTLHIIRTDWPTVPPPCCPFDDRTQFRIINPAKLLKWVSRVWSAVL